MPLPITDVRTYADTAGLEALKRGARTNDPSAVKAVAKQFESLFARMMIKSMRDAVGKDPIFGSDQEQTYQEMFDDQLSIELTRGKGLGLADMLVRQLQRMSGTAAGADPSAASAGSGSPAAASAPPGRASSAASPPTASALPPATAAEKSRFVQSLWPAAQQAAQALGVDARALVAQAALETSWGRSTPTRAGGSSNNLFGIKATGWSGGTVDAATREFSGGASLATTARFRAYGSPEQSLQDYVALLRSPRYAAARNTGGNVQAFAAALQQGGYATDPDYARKLSAIAAELGAAPGQAAPAPLADAGTAGTPSVLKFTTDLPMTGERVPLAEGT
jgi:peptidoglycan hydrolase FlgJ